MNNHNNNIGLLSNQDVHSANQYTMVFFLKFILFSFHHSHKNHNIIQVFSKNFKFPFIKLKLYFKL